MRYAQLPIQTHREPPAGARSPGAALLIRAGYVSHNGELLPLGQAVITRLQNLVTSAAGESLLMSLAAALEMVSTSV